MKVFHVVLLCVLFLAGCAQRGMQESPMSSMDTDTEFLYVANQGEATVSVIAIGTNEIVQTIDLKQLGFSENAKPHHIAVEPDGSFWYLSMIGENKVLKFNRANELVGQAAFEVPGMLAVHPTDGMLMVGRSMSAVNPPQSIGVIKRSDMSVEEISVLFPRPHALVVDPRGDFFYSASLAQNQIASVDAVEESVDLVSMKGPVHTIVQFALSPDGNTMVASTELTNKVMIFDTSTPLKPVLVDSISVNAAPWHPVYSPDGRHVYVGNKRANTISVLDIPARKVVKVIEGEGIAQPHGSAISPDGRYVYISNNNMDMHMVHQPGNQAMSGDHPVGTVVVIDTQTNAIVKVIPVGMMPTGINTRPAR